MHTCEDEICFLRDNNALRHEWVCEWSYCLYKMLITYRHLAKVLLSTEIILSGWGQLLNDQHIQHQ